MNDSAHALSVLAVHGVDLPGTGHWVPYEAAARVNQLLLDFFE